MRDEIALKEHGLSRSKRIGERERKIQPQWNRPEAGKILSSGIKTPTPFNGFIGTSKLVSLQNGWHEWVANADAFALAESVG